MMRDIWLGTAGVLAGGLTSWLISHVYHRLAGKHSAAVAAEYKAMLQKLPADSLDALRADKRANLTVRELNDLLREKTVDPTSTDIFPYKACPECGSDNMYETRDAIVDHDGPYWYRVKRCEDCGWQTDEMKVRAFHL